MSKLQLKMPLTMASGPTLVRWAPSIWRISDWNGLSLVILKEEPLLGKMMTSLSPKPSMPSITGSKSYTVSDKHFNVMFALLRKKIKQDMGCFGDSTQAFNCCLYCYISSVDWINRTRLRTSLGNWNWNIIFTWANPWSIRLAQKKTRKGSP